MFFAKPAAMTSSPAKLLLIAAAVLPAITAAQVRRTAVPTERVLDFPADRSVGGLMIYTGPVTDPADTPVSIEPVPDSPHWVMVNLSSP